MTTARYIVARIAQAFGVVFRSHHATNAAAELHLLREAEEILGRLAWKDLENLEDLSVEYWNLRKLDKEHTELTGELATASGILQQSHDERASLMEKVTESTRDLVVEREALVEKSERLDSERDMVLAEARAVKRRHDGLKAKLDVLTEEGHKTDEITETNEELAQLRKRFKLLRDRRNKLAARIEEIDASIEELDARIEKRRKSMREEALGSFQNIGKANRNISTSRAELGNVENEMISLYCEIGRYLCAHGDEPECKEILRPHRTLLGQMKALRVSINCNNKLAGREPPFEKI
jgi:chromosome segregation ATPase